MYSPEPYLIFTNPSFFLYQAPVNLPAICPTQINRFIQKLNSIPFTPTQKHKNLKTCLNNLHLTSSTHVKLPNYSYKNLKKGMVCNHCQQFVSFSAYASVLCQHCGTREKLETAVHRSIMEFTTLFPGEKITTRIIQDWCHIVPSKKAIRRILMKYLHLAEKGKHAYYILKD